jgi:hypothetical protein
MLLIRVPRTKGLFFVKLPDRIVLVDPDTQLVTEIIVEAATTGSSTKPSEPGSGDAQGRDGANPKSLGPLPDDDGAVISNSAFSLRAAAVVLAMIVLHSRMDRAAAQEIGLTPLEASEIARGYRPNSSN